MNVLEIKEIRNKENYEIKKNNKEKNRREFANEEERMKSSRK